MKETNQSSIIDQRNAHAAFDGRLCVPSWTNGIIAIWVLGLMLAELLKMCESEMYGKLSLWYRLRKPPEKFTSQNNNSNGATTGFKIVDTFHIVSSD